MTTVTVPVAKVADGVSAGVKVVKAGVHLSDGNTEAAIGELVDAVVVKLGRNLTKQQKDVHQSTFDIF